MSNKEILDIHPGDHVYYEDDGLAENDGVCGNSDPIILGRKVHAVYTNAENQTWLNVTPTKPDNREWGEWIVWIKPEQVFRVVKQSGEVLEQDGSKARGRKQCVVCAALRAKDGDVLIGIRHYDATMTTQIRHRSDGNKFNGLDDADQGFVDQWGEFLNREEAWVVAVSNGQIKAVQSHRPGILFSEDLY